MTTFNQRRTLWARMMVADPRLDREAKVIGLYLGGLATEENQTVELSDDDIAEGVLNTPLAVIAERVGFLPVDPRYPFETRIALIPRFSGWVGI